MRAFSDRLETKWVSLWNWIIHCTFFGMDQDFSRYQIWLQRLYLILLYLLISGVWAFFLDFGNFVWGVQDWVLEWRYSKILQEAITTGQIPLHTDPPLQFGISRVFGIPDVNLAPQIFLLRFLDPGLNFLINVLLMVTISYIGCLLIRRHFRLSLFSFSVLAILFDLNGFITAHLGIGHTFFTGYFFLPFFVLLLLQLVEQGGSKNWFAKMGLVLFGIELLGSSRILVACLFFIGMFFLFYKPARLQLFKAVIAGVMLNAYRIAPAIIALPPVNMPTFAGFSTLSDLFMSLIWIIPPSKSFVGLPIAWWEFDMYVSLLGLGFIVYFGLYKTYRPDRGELSNALHRPLMITILFFGIFSIGYLYMPIHSLPLSLFKLVRVPSRFFILPLLLLIALASIRMQEWLDRKSSQPWHYLVLSILLAVFLHDILQHARLWRVEFVFESFSGGPFEVPLDFGLHIANQVDPLYTNTLILSSIATLISLGYVLYLLRKGRGGSKDQMIKGNGLHAERDNRY